MVQSNSPQPSAASPQLVGREFVRQYYTMMGEAPKHVYRFYSNESVYVFNGSEPVIGQQAVSDRIESLNLKDCHTKIRVVDAHETLQRGVVVQVIGEISVNGGALRRFAQTFVLALQTEKKYYVHNDTFRYLDDLFDESATLVHDTEANVIADETEQALINNNVNRTTLNGNLHPEEMVQGSQMTVYANQQPLPPRSANVNSNSSSISRNQESTPEPTNYNVLSSEWDSASSGVGTVPTSGAPLQQFPQQQGGGGDADSIGFEEQHRPASKDSSAPSEDHEDVGKAETGAVSWANVAGKVTSTGPTKRTPPVVPAPTTNAKPPSTDKSNNYQTTPGQANNAGRTTDGSMNNARSSPAPSYSGANNRPNKHAGGGGPSGYGGRGTDSNLDELQIFVGNLPEDVAESELNNCFSQFGTVKEIKLRTRPQTFPNRPFPSFAFVTMATIESVQKILDAPNNFSIRDRHHVTVECKRGDDGPRTGPRGDKDRVGQSGTRIGGRVPSGPSRGYRGGGSGGGGGGSGGRGGGGGGGGARMFTASRHPPASSYGNGGGNASGHLTNPPGQPKS